LILEEDWHLEVGFHDSTSAANRILIGKAMTQSEWIRKNLCDICYEKEYQPISNHDSSSHAKQLKNHGHLVGQHAFHFLLLGVLEQATRHSYEDYSTYDKSKAFVLAPSCTLSFRNHRDHPEGYTSDQPSKRPLGMS
jgi:hypothetical protein